LAGSVKLPPELMTFVTVAASSKLVTWPKTGESALLLLKLGVPGTKAGVACEIDEQRNTKPPSRLLKF
jgi:hypothetical protein